MNSSVETGNGTWRLILRFSRPHRSHNPRTLSDRRSPGPARAHAPARYTEDTAADQAHTGRTFMGGETNMSDVVYVTEEQRRTFRRGLARAGVNSERVHVMLAEGVRGTPLRELVDQVLAKVKETGAALVVLDTLAHFAPGIDGNPQAVMEVFEELRRITAAGVAGLATRHTRKSGGDVGLSGRGSSAAAGAVDIILALERLKDLPGSVRRLRALSRYEETPEEILVQRTETGFEVVEGLGEVHVDHQAAILGALPAAVDDAIPADAVLAVTGLTKTLTRDALAALVTTGRAACTGAGVKGDPRLYYRRAA